MKRGYLHGRLKYPLIEIKGSGKYEEVTNSRIKITDQFVLSDHILHVASTDQFKVGDRIILFRPGTPNGLKPSE